MIKYFVRLIIIFLIVSSSQAFALTIENKLEDTAQEQRAREVFSGIRCMVCSGESIADSRADLAKELREIVRERIKSGNSNQQVLDYISSRYGKNILMQPPFEPGTYLLWFGPFIFISVGFAVLLFSLRRKK